MRKKIFLKGLRLGVPIALGYFPASFSFGILAMSFGFQWWQAVLISMVTLTSAGQLSGIYTMRMPGDFLGMAISQLTINARYSVMGISISQHISPRFTGLKRLLLSFFLTDEIFAMANMEEEVTPEIFMGLAVAPYFGWALGTLCGTLLGSVLPPILMDAFGLALYGLFIAVVVPSAKKEKIVLTAAGLAAVFNSVLYYLPTGMSREITISLASVAAAAIASLLFPVSEEVEV